MKRGKKSTLLRARELVDDLIVGYENKPPETSVELSTYTLCLLRTLLAGGVSRTDANLVVQPLWNSWRMRIIKKRRKQSIINGTKVGVKLVKA